MYKYVEVCINSLKYKYIKYIQVFYILHIYMCVSEYKRVSINIVNVITETHTQIISVGPIFFLCQNVNQNGLGIFVCQTFYVL